MSHTLLHANTPFLPIFLGASVAVVALALIAERLARRASAAARHAIVLAALLVPPVLFAAATIDWPRAGGGVGGRVGGGVVGSAAAETAEWPCVLAAIWLAGAAVGIARTVAGAARWRRVALRATRVDRDHATSVECLEPTVIGIVDPLIVLPANHEFTPAELQAVFAHERAHIARRDNLGALVVQLVSSLFWFDPLHLVARRRLVELRERACDDLVLARGCDPAAYAAALARSCETSFNPGAVACMSRLALHERMESIMTPQNPRRRLPAWIPRTFLTAAVAATAIAFAAFAPSPRLSAGGTAKRLSENKNIVRPKVLSSVDARYTKEAKEKKIAGTVVLDATIDEKGKVSAVSVVKALPHGLDQAAVDALRQWRFEPATLDGKPVPVIMNLTFNFKLE